ncbi:1,4-dihydroxy-2-naphthoate polyprenyltransferase [Schaalia sp. ZJ1691]|uniref:1,4-dihydroxy-2-naphthoate polyprenyltransferase n=1 Tax=Schaalia sp. ZJ1691 TaxID=2709404 RepID=UPI0013ECCDBE|nr:1,4-dihydroxy-2-naphthoate polyprenyltransferase [Schaalia sp. ZJ1691]
MSTGHSQRIEGDAHRSARLSDWVEGARLRTLPAACAPVLVGAAAAYHLGEWHVERAILALIVALLLQIGVNFSNDYSDGIRGTDEFRQGPPRLTGGGLASPRTVLGAALGCFGVAGLAGLVLLALSHQWFLIIFGLVAVIAAWFYTGGRHPYGYMGVGLSELMVFVFFGLFATVGTTWTQTPHAPGWLWALASGLGLLSVALLMVNNIRDIPTDRESGKKTLAVRLDDTWSRWLYGLCVVFPVAVLVVVALLRQSPLIVVICTGLGALFGSVLAIRPVVQGATGRDLIPVLRNTGLFTLAWGILAAFVLIVA